ncbi:dTDP-4-dehydrorhamnose reductase [Pseudothauera nasutitermitis]|uniref:dTDP-4-dehydrorhamnose reductase n=1 Tax=Pseudothauera nasutitermitis TaxID=2565930 RepID=A0A4V3WBE8_9RHOO|nr:dTDP-4-dehydrorhamnose reductase [Pseudothauera nasutitermitis]THF62959.1 dTDP-4-dehydrorhamnose reductase [Pseudothauera nasutitermitis]
MKILLTGASGQVGWELARSLQPLGEVVAPARAACDLARPETLAALVDRVAPQLIVNAAAYTAVDRAESEEALATRVNAEAVAELARAARRHGALLVHYSTDYVFDGGKAGAYREDDVVAPLNAYGRGKLAGERAVLASGCDHLIFRTTWVYAARGANFLRTMLRLGAERETLRVVADQVGAPTWARNIADATALAVAQARRERAEGRFESGLFHLAGGGETSWHGFAEAIFALAREKLPEQPLKVARVEAIGSAEYPTPAVRPLNSRLNQDALAARFGLRLPPWRDALARCIEELGTR